MKKNNILMLVRNSVSHDARVLKTANSLQRYGHQVDIVGVIDNKNTNPEELLSNGTLVKRIGIKSPVFKILYRFYYFLFFLSLLPSLFFYKDITAGIDWILASFDFNEFMRLLDAIKYSDYSLALLLTFWIYFLFKKIRINRRFYVNYSHLEKNIGKPNNSSILLRIRRLPSHFKKLKAQISVTYVYSKQVVEYFNKGNYTYVHCHDIYTLPVGVFLKIRYKIALIYDAHEMYEEAVGVGLLLSKAYKVVHKMSQKHLDGFITINKSFCKIYKDRYPRLPEPVLVMNATYYSKNDKYDGRLHEAAGLTLDTKIILFQGGFTNHRGIERILNMAKCLGDGWCTVFMGWGGLEKLIDKESRSYPHKIVRIPAAPQSELDQWSSGAYVGLIPYEDFGMNHMYCTPNKLWEYPNAGVPIVASPRVELKKIVERYNTGWIYDECLSAKALAEFVMDSSSLDHNEKLESCSQFIRTNNWAKYEDNIFGLYDSLSSSQTSKVGAF